MHSPKQFRPKVDEFGLAGSPNATPLASPTRYAIDAWEGEGGASVEPLGTDLLRAALANNVVRSARSI